MSINPDQQLQNILSQKAFSRIDIESNRDHMGDFPTFMDCFREIIEGLELDPSNQAVALRFICLCNTKIVENVLFYHPSGGEDLLKTQFLKLYPNSLEN